MGKIAVPGQAGLPNLQVICFSNVEAGFEITLSCRDIIVDERDVSIVGKYLEVRTEHIGKPTYLPPRDKKMVYAVFFDPGGVGGIGGNEEIERPLTPHLDP